jgi:hypothetical protein
MRAIFAVALLGSTALWAQQPSAGMPPRSDAADYAARGEDKGVKVAAEMVSPDQVRNMFATDLSNYIVVEVAVWPASGKALDLSPIDFALKLDDSRAPIRSVSPKTIAGVQQRKGQSRRDDITLYPTVGMQTGSWGTGTMIGVGVGMGGSNPGPASTDQDRRTMQLELDEKGLPDSVVQKPVAGYLYFPAGTRGKKTATGELTYESDAATVLMTIPIEHK